LVEPERFVGEPSHRLEFCSPDVRLLILRKPVSEESPLLSPRHQDGPHTTGVALARICDAPLEDTAAEVGVGPFTTRSMASHGAKSPNSFAMGETREDPGF